MNTQRRLRPEEAIYQPLPAAQIESLPPVLVWLPEGERPLHDVEDTLKYHLQLQLPRSTYETWVRPLRLVAVDESTATIQAANALAEDWLKKRLVPKLELTLSLLVGRNVAVRIEAPG